ncbi:hypothetical protein PHLCEN_2v4626 [Hermanssonia centrifuga]|uniref:Uncharacterized protein n=1 Tax=Hermanssonia centrifuga TaxID=98765 RepID=A0A2R6PMU4_9APHY|nr:hypothetical protein PHLCEN_2v4626 [Hermanssonia centrifuga]
MFSVLRTILAPQVEAVPEAGILSSEQLLASSDAASNECLSISVSLSEPQSEDQTLETKGVLQRSARVVTLENQPVISDTTLGVLDSKSLKPVTGSSPVVVVVGNENTQPISTHAPSGDGLHRTEPVTSFSQQSIKAVQAPSSPRIDQLCKSAANRRDFQEYEEGQGVLRIQAGKIEPLGIPVPSTYADATNVSDTELYARGL